MSEQEIEAVNDIITTIGGLIIIENS